MYNKAYMLKFNNGAPFWRVYDGGTGFCVSEHRSSNAAKKKVKRMNKRKRMTECVLGRKIDPSMMLGNLEALTEELPPSDWVLGWKPIGGWAKPQKQEGNNPMNYAYNNTAAATIVADTSEKDKRNYLATRISNLRYEKGEDLREMFGFGPVKAPRTAKEALERIQAGKFTIKGADKDTDPRYFDFWEDFTWRDPSVKQDEEGLVKAQNELTDLLDDLRDIIAVKPIDEAFNTLQTLKDWQPSGKPN